MNTLWHPGSSHAHSAVLDLGLIIIILTQSAVTEQTNIMLLSRVGGQYTVAGAEDAGENGGVVDYGRILLDTWQLESLIHFLFDFKQIVWWLEPDKLF